MHTPDLPAWVAPLCCAVPFLSLLALAISTLAGAPISSLAFAIVSALCYRTTCIVFKVTAA